MKEKLLLTLTLSLLFGIGVGRVQSQTSLIMNFLDNTEKSSALSSLNKITFSESNLTLNHGIGTIDSYIISSIRKLVFGSTSGINSLLADTKCVIIYPNPATNYIALKNATDGELNVTIYRIDGPLLKSALLTSSSQTIDVSQLQKGLYFLKVNNQAFKFTKL